VKDQSELLCLDVVLEPLFELFVADKKAGCLVKKSIKAADSIKGILDKKSLGKSG